MQRSQAPPAAGCMERRAYLVSMLFFLPMSTYYSSYLRLEPRFKSSQSIENNILFDTMTASSLRGVAKQRDGTASAARLYATCAY